MNLQELENLENRAQAGDARAMRHLGNLYKEGKVFGGLTIPKNSEKSRRLIEAASAKRWAALRRAINPSKLPENLSVLADLIDNVIVKVEKAIVFIFEKLGVILVFVALSVLGIGVFWLFAIGISALSVSAAIILGAVIIAASIRR